MRFEDGLRPNDRRPTVLDLPEGIYTPDSVERVGRLRMKWARRVRRRNRRARRRES
jgi:hypothetical protein